MREFTFKPALVRKQQVWAIKEDHLMRRGAAQALKLADVTSASWNSVSYRGTRSAWLHLTAGDQTTKIECTDSGGGRGEFLALIHAVARVLERVNPDLPIRYGYAAPWRMALFILALLGSLFGLFFVFAGLTDMTGKGAVQATIAGAAMCILLVPVAWSCRPDVKGTTGGPASLAALIESLGGSSVQDPDRDSGEA